MPDALLTIEALKQSAIIFAGLESAYAEPLLFGVNDGKSVGTYLEAKFKAYLALSFDFLAGNAAKGIDLPLLNVDFKTTSTRQPQSSCPYRSPRQKIYGLGYSLLIFVYEKFDDQAAKTGRLNILHTIFVEKERTADFQMTQGLLQIIERAGNEDDIIAFMLDKNLLIDEIEAQKLAGEILAIRPLQGYLTISNALQWRLQYTRVIELAGKVEGVQRLQ